MHLVLAALSLVVGLVAVGTPPPAPPLGGEGSTETDRASHSFLPPSPLRGGVGGGVPTAQAASYRSTLEDALTDLQRNEPDIEQVVSDLRAIGPVTLDDGSVIQVDVNLIIDDLEADPPDIAGAISRLEALLDVIDDEAPAATRGDDADRLLRDVLARDEFNERGGEEPRSLWWYIWTGISRAAEWAFGPLLGWIERLFGDGDGDDSWSDLVGVASAVLGIGIVLALIAWVVRNVRRAIGPSVVRLGGMREDARLTSIQARAEAERLFGEGAYRSAMRALYLATLIRWEEAGRLRFDRSLTNREVLARANTQGDAVLIEQLSPLVERFDRVWYGGAPCDAGDYQSFAQLASRAWEAA